MPDELCLSMEIERRQAIRKKVRMPLAWQSIDEAIKIQEVLPHFTNPAGASLLAALQSIDTELTSAFDSLSQHERVDRAQKNISGYRASLKERQHSSTLHLLNSKLDLLIQHAVYPTPTTSYDLCLSAQGCALALTDVSVGSRVGIHMLLPTHQHAICTGTVKDSGTTQRVVFDDFGPGSELAVSRFLLLCD